MAKRLLLVPLFLLGTLAMTPVVLLAAVVRLVAGYESAKRTFDIFFSLGWLLAFSPLLLAVGLLVRLKLGSPILFSQVRPGKDAQPFRMVKFRTMTDARDETGNLLPDNVRLTPFGRFLRSSSLDEFPEMANVLLGDMSVVGPRPLLMEYVPLYDATQRRRLEVKPGVTGWAQINGRNALSWDEKFGLDTWYVEHRSLLLDLRIVARTFFKVFARSGIDHSADRPMPRFTGKAVN
jgi:lipopolysaccharide/colanic/teichoic acid biosynthesis glycosyltransferase